MEWVRDTNIVVVKQLVVERAASWLHSVGQYHVSSYSNLLSTTKKARSCHLIPFLEKGWGLGTRLTDNLILPSRPNTQDQAIYYIKPGSLKGT